MAHPTATRAGRAGPSRLPRPAALGLALAAALAAGCGNQARRIEDLETRHGVTIEVTGAARGENWLGGSTALVLENVGKELAALPYLATAGQRIYLASSADLVRTARPEEFLDALLAGAATQDRPGPDQGDVYVLNKNLWGLYVDFWQPGTTRLQDPHLRHEMMHAIEIVALRDLVLAEPWQAALEGSGQMLDRMEAIDRLALEMPPEALLTARHEAYVDLCARWLAAHFGDVTGDGRTDDADLVCLRARRADFDADGDGHLTYEDAAARTGLRYSRRRGADPATQVEMTAGLVGYRPRGFASPYGRTYPWEDRAEVLDYAIREGLIPHLFAAPGSMPGVTAASAAEAGAKLDRLRARDAVLARKVEILALYLGNLTPPNDRAADFAARYAAAMVPFERLAASPDAEGPRVAEARRASLARRMAAYRYTAVAEGDTLTVLVSPAGETAAGP